MADLDEHLARVRRLGVFLERRREQLGESQSEMGRRTGTNQSLISRIEQGRLKDLAVRYLQPLAEAYEVPLELILQILQSDELPDLDVKAKLASHQSSESGAGVTIRDLLEHQQRSHEHFEARIAALEEAAERREAILRDLRRRVIDAQDEREIWRAERENYEHQLSFGEAARRVSNKPASKGPETDRPRLQRRTTPRRTSPRAQPDPES